MSALNSMRTKTIMGVGWATVDGLAAQGLAFLVFLVMARLLSPQDFGLVALANLYVMVAQFLITIGLGQAVVQFADLDEEYLDTAFWQQTAIGIFFFAATLAVPSWIAGFLGNARLTPVVAALSPLFIFSGVSQVQTAVLSRQMNFRALAIRTSGSYLIGGAAGVVMAVQGYGVWSLVWQQLVGGAVRLFLVWRVSEWRPRFFFSRAKARRLLAFGWHGMATDLSSLISRRSDQYFIGKFLGAIPCGYYAIAARVSNLVSEIMIRPLARVTMASFSRLQGDEKRFAAAFFRVVEMQSLLILPATVGLALLAPEAIVTLFGEKWLSAVPPMRVLLLGGLFEALTAVHSSALVSRGQPGWCNLLISVHLMGNLVAFAIAVRWGMEAVAIASVARAAVLYPLELMLLRKILGFSPWRSLATLAPLLGITAGMAMLVYVLKLGTASLPPLATLVIGSSSGALFFAGAVYCARRPLFEEITSYLRWFRGSRLQKEVDQQTGR